MKMTAQAKTKQETFHVGFSSLFIGTVCSEMLKDLLQR